MSKKPLLPLIVTVTVLFLAASGLSVFAAKAIAQNRAATKSASSERLTEAGDLDLNEDIDENDIEESEAEESEVSESETAESPDVEETTPTIDTTASATIPYETGLVDDEGEDNDDQDENEPSEFSNQLISLDAAKSIALAQVGSDAVILEAELDAEDNPPKYEITLIAGGYEYEIEIHAVTGAIIEMEREPAEAPDTESGEGSDEPDFD